MSEEKMCRHILAKRMVLYTDTVGGEQVCRDDMWAVTTDELHADADGFENEMEKYSKANYLIGDYMARLQMAEKDLDTARASPLNWRTE